MEGKPLDKDPDGKSSWRFGKGKPKKKRKSLQRFMSEGVAHSPAPA
jgi:hypothetical protein